MRKVHQTVTRQIPEFMREEYPRFIEFIQQYYRFLDQSTTYDVGDAIDLDTAPDSLIDDFYETYAKGLPTPNNFTKRDFLRHCKEFYSTKGTPASFNFLFRAFFNRDAEISLPSQNIIRASDGQWIQYHSIDAHLVYGDENLIVERLQLDLSNPFGTFSIEVQKVEKIDGEVFRLFFFKRGNIQLTENQIVDVKNSNGIVILRLRIAQTTTAVEVVSPGKNFKVGMILSIPGTYTNTLARVFSVDSNGGIVSLRVIEFGFDHTNGDLCTVSPYKNQPNKTASQSTTVGTSHTLTIAEYIDIYEVITLANGTQTIEARTIHSTGGVSSPNLTMAEWLVSRATLRIAKGMIAAQPGKYISSRSLISDPYAVLQDNYYYQLYSYVIRSEVDERDYSKAVEMIHPAGLKRFGELIKTAAFDLSGSISDERYQLLVLDLNDSVHVSDLITMAVSKSISDTAVITEDIVKNVAPGTFSDSAGMAVESAVYFAPTGYAAADYFAADYNALSHTLVIS